MTEHARRREKASRRLLSGALCFCVSAVSFADGFDGESSRRISRASAAAFGGAQESRDGNAETNSGGAQEPVVLRAEPVELVPFDAQLDAETAQFLRQVSPFRPASMLQPTPFAAPDVALAPDSGEAADGADLAARVFQDTGIDRSLLRSARLAPQTFGVDAVSGSEALPKVTTDAGDLLGKSPSILGVSVQRRTPVVNDPRIRSSRIGSLAASGSYWVPARADLDTALSKIDSRQVENIVVVPGPYSSLYYPGFHFVDVELVRSPRFGAGRESHGRTTVDFQHNGRQWLGQQQIATGAEDWGVSLNYAHRTGEDYRSGANNRIPASYNSREWVLSAGRDLAGSRSIEFTLLRLDQTDVEFPGYVFDMDFLVTDGYEVTYTDSGSSYFDSFEAELWYNRTRFAGNAQNRAKRDQFPLLDRLGYVGTTDVDSMSTGYRSAWTWGEETGVYVTAGQDLRVVNQELNEISSGFSLGAPVAFVDRNSPVPDSVMANPGLFVEYHEPLFDRWDFRSGARFDYAYFDVGAEASQLAAVGLDANPPSYAEVVGTDQFQRDIYMGSLYAALQQQIDQNLSSVLSVGYAERAPTLTALYAAQPFLLLLQNGLNNVTGDPTLAEEKLIQVDLGLNYQNESLRAGIRGFHGWAFDYITFENTGIQRGPPRGDVQQIDLRYVNTELATLTGFEGYGEWMTGSRLTPFFTTRYTDGRDRTRNGDFATRPGTQGTPSDKVAGLPRGFFSNLIGADSEPLPGIAPFETRLGLRLSGAGRRPLWNLELEARVVDNQDRVATSLLETPTAGFTIWNLRTVITPPSRPGLTMVAGVENFTDKQYREHLDFRSLTGVSVFQPGVNFYTGADYVY